MSRKLLFGAVAAILAALALLPLSPTPSAAALGSSLRAQAGFGRQPTGYTPAQIADAYSFSPLYQAGLTGAGQKIALIEMGGVNASDLNYFDSTYNLPRAHIVTHYAGGSKFGVSADPEATLDVEWAHALAPNATILIWYLNGNLSMKAGWAALGSAVRAAAGHGARTISLSFGACQPGAGYAATSAALADAAARNVSVFVSSGDDGDLPGPIRDCGNTRGVAYPASDPSVVAVGGTSLNLSSDNSIISESAWNLSGGGAPDQLKLPRPVWEKAPTMPAGTTRLAPDVAFVADPSTGVNVYYRGRWEQTGGTSLGAPAWAAAWALFEQSAQQAGKTLGTAGALVYRIGNSSAYAADFHDIVDGSNGSYRAGPGWDAVTGWGSPDVQALDGTLLSLAG